MLVGFWGWMFKKLTWNRDKKAWRGEAVKLGHTLACRVLAGGFKKRTWNRDKNSWRGEYSCM